jgi:T5SS/PEP-CTERM-associated repeat protein
MYSSLSSRLRLSNRQCLLVLPAIVGLLTGVVPQALAVDRDWNQATGTTGYVNADNWSPTGVPSLMENVAFGPNLVGLDVNVVLAAPELAVANNVTFTNGNVEFIGFGGVRLDNAGVVTIDDVLASDLASGARVSLNGTGGVVWDSVGDAIVGDAGYGTLTINSGGSFRSQDIFVGNQLDSVGVVNVDGVGSLLQTDGTEASNGFFIGNSGTGTLNVAGGGLARIVNDVSGGIADFELGVLADGVGTLNVEGPGSQIIAEDVVVGNAGAGTVTITAGGVFNQNIGPSPDAFVAQQAGATGDVTVHGDGSQWLMARLEIGNLGDATLSVEAGGLVRSNSNDMALGDAGGSGRVAVFGAGASNSTLQVANDLYVGSAGSGDVRIGQDLAGTTDGRGALQVNRHLFIGNNAGNNFDNRLTVDGNAATVNVVGTLDVGRGGRGTLEAYDGATITAGSWVYVGLSAGSSGTVLLDGAGTTLSARGFLVGNTTAGSTGEVTVSGGAVATLTGGTDAGNAATAVTLGDDGAGVGTLTVTGVGSLVQTTNVGGGWFIGGSGNETGGTGTANILDGGQGISASRVVIGHGTGAVGTLNVDGPNSQFDANGDYILIGFEGQGQMNVTGGGTANANRMFVADAVGSAGSQLDIHGTGSSVNISRHLHVGDSAPGVVNVTGGAQLNVATSNLAERLIIGDESTTDASRLTVSGAGSRVDYFGTDRVSVGFAGGGSFNDPVVLEVLDGAVFEMEHANVNSSSGVFVADEANSAGLVTIDGSGSRLHTRRLLVSDSTGTRGTVNITGGGTIDVDEFVEIGSAGDGDGFLTVSGVGSRLDVGGDLSAAAGASNLRVDGTITIADGGAITNGNQGFIGRATTNVGIVNVGGAGALATWQVGTDLFIAGNDSLTAGGSQQSGSGTLNAVANGLVTVGGTLVLKDRGTINLTGGEVAANDFLFQDFAERALSPTVNFASGTLRYTASKTLDAASIDTILGGSATLANAQHLAIDGLAVFGGSIRVDGGTLSLGSISAANFRQFIDFDAGTLNLTNSDLIVGTNGLFGSAATIAAGQTVNVIANPGGNAVAEVNVVAASTLTVVGELTADTIFNDGQMVWIDSTGDGRTVAAQYFASAGSTTTLVGDTTFTNTVGGQGGFFGPGTAVFAGGLSPGSSPGTMTLESDVALASTNTLLIELAGIESGQFDRLVTESELTFGGTLQVTLLDGFVPSLGQAFDVFDAASFAGMFDSMVLPALAGGLSWNTERLYADGVLSVASAVLLPGDYNNDGHVDAADYTVWRDMLGSTGADLAADGNGDLVVDQADYSVWRANFGNSQSASLAATGAAVPELPSQTLLSLLMCGILVVVGGRGIARPCRTPPSPWWHRCHRS